MSKENKAPNDTKSLTRYIEWLSTLGVVKKVYVAGSRSPLRSKKPHKHSDWDLVIETNIEKLKLPNPRRLGVLHADLLILNSEQVKNKLKIVEIYPEDKYKILNYD